MKLFGDIVSYGLALGAAVGLGTSLTRMATRATRARAVHNPRSGRP
jgi:hypothetical protein